MIQLKRAYEPKERKDGFRILVDRLWPRGIKKEDMHVDIWLKEIAPSSALRKWFNHDPEKWITFKTKYKAELQQSASLDELKQLIEKHKTITLVYSAKDEEHNQAVVLKELLNKQ
ncbi:MAG TPA: DUF488 domain-containing protein [Parafilimonas sp.]|nr:DUF488 domain-containing protein [Parafilimonas sp.]